MSRREQLGTDDAALKNGLEAEDEEDPDHNPDQPQESDVHGDGQTPVAKAKAKGRPKASATPKSGAKAKAKPGAKPKAKHGTRKRAAEAKLEETKERAKKLCKVKPSEDGQRQKNGKQQEQQEESASKVEGKKEDLKEKGTNEVKDTKKRKTKGEIAEKHESKDMQIAKAPGKEAPAEVATFARRYMPEDEAKAIKYRCIRDVFMASLSDKLKAQSRFQDPSCILSFQLTKYLSSNFMGSFFTSGHHRFQHFPWEDPFFKACQAKLKKHRDATTYDEIAKIVQGYVSEFLELEDVRI